jgi:hypothetical protein
MHKQTTYVVFVSSIYMFLYSLQANAWTIENTFDSQGVGEHCKPLWNGKASIVTDVKSYSGSKACRMKIREGSNSDGEWGGGINHPEKLGKGDEIWLRLRTFWPVGFDYNSYSSGNNLKYLRFRTKGADNSNHGYVDWYLRPKGSVPPFQIIYEGVKMDWSKFGSEGDAIEFGKWETYEFYVKFDNIPASNGGMARIRTWKNGKLLTDIKNVPTLKEAGTTSGDTLIFTYWNGGSPATQEMYVDDIVLTSDKPSARDASGNPYIGMGQAEILAAPLPPNLLK